MFSLIAVCVVWGLVAAGAVLAAFAMVSAPFLIVAWVLFALFTLYFFRDPEARPIQAANQVLSPAHGKVDAIDVITESGFMGGECRRVSIFLSVVDVHVQNAPISGKVAHYKYTIGQFLNALRKDSADFNENVLLGFESSDVPGLRVGVRLIAGVIARRIVPYVKLGDEVKCGERISLIQFGSRADVYLPMHATILVKLGDKVKGGQTFVAEVPGQ